MYISYPMLLHDVHMLRIVVIQCADVLLCYIVVYMCYNKMWHDVHTVFHVLLWFTCNMRCCYTMHMMWTSTFMLTYVVWWCYAMYISCVTLQCHVHIFSHIVTCCKVLLNLRQHATNGVTIGNDVTTCYVILNICCPMLS